MKSLGQQLMECHKPSKPKKFKIGCDICGKDVTPENIEDHWMYRDEMVMCEDCYVAREYDNLTAAEQKRDKEEYLANVKED